MGGGCPSSPLYIGSICYRVDTADYRIRCDLVSYDKQNGLGNAFLGRPDTQNSGFDRPRWENTRILKIGTSMIGTSGKCGKPFSPYDTAHLLMKPYKGLKIWPESPKAGRNL